MFINTIVNGCCSFHVLHLDTHTDTNFRTRAHTCSYFCNQCANPLRTHTHCRRARVSVSLFFSLSHYASLFVCVCAQAPKNNAKRKKTTKITTVSPTLLSLFLFFVSHKHREPRAKGRASLKNVRAREQAGQIMANAKTKKTLFCFFVVSKLLLLLSLNCLYYYSLYYICSSCCCCC